MDEIHTWLDKTKKKIRKFKRTTDSDYPPDPFINIPCPQKEEFCIVQLWNSVNQKGCGDKLRDAGSSLAGKEHRHENGRKSLHIEGKAYSSEQWILLSELTIFLASNSECP